MEGRASRQSCGPSGQQTESGQESSCGTLPPAQIPVKSGFGGLLIGGQRQIAESKGESAQKIPADKAQMQAEKDAQRLPSIMALD